jgi:uncharacterized protein YndB with AHSA1/START domain
MKYFKLFAAFLLSVIITIAILSFFMATSLKVEKSITINAPASAVFEQLVKLENFNAWSVWNRQDSAIKHVIIGTDGTVGAVSNWKGQPEISGEGKIEITSVEKDRKVTHTIHFLKPQKNKAESVFTLTETDRGVTKLTWQFMMATPRPWNIFNLFYSMDKERGKDFDDGLSSLKKIIEKKQATPLIVQVK